MWDDRTLAGDCRGTATAAAGPQELAKVSAALPTSAPAKPAKARKVLVFGRTGVGAFFEKGYVHKTIPLGCETIGMLGEKTGTFQAVVSYDPSMFDPEKLKEFDGIVLVSTTNDFLDEPNNKKAEEARKQALLSFVRDGKGLVGIHAAGDAYFNWPQYGQMIGAYFSRHTTPRRRSPSSMRIHITPSTPRLMARASTTPTRFTGFFPSPNST